MAFIHFSFEFSSTGDASETEIDTVLLLTAECYLVAEYDSDLDKVVRFEKVCRVYKIL